MSKPTLVVLSMDSDQVSEYCLCIPIYHVKIRRKGSVAEGWEGTKMQETKVLK